MSEEHNVRLTFKHGSRETIITQAWQNWTEHVASCEACQAVIKSAYKEAKDANQLFGAAWAVGFSCAMDMVEAGYLAPMKGTGTN